MPNLSPLQRYARIPLFFAGLSLLLLNGCKTPGIDEAAENGQSDKVAQMIDQGADPNTQDKFGYTPLHWAAYEGQLETVKVLVDKGAKLEARDHSQSTPLLLAANRGFPDVVKYLLDKGADANARDKDGWTPLHYAARNGYAEIVRSLLDHNADMNAHTTATDQTPLALARSYGRDEVVKILSDKGAK